MAQMDLDVEFPTGDGECKNKKLVSPVTFRTQAQIKNLYL